MARNIRFFPVNHDINADPELWELTNTFGDRALRVWLEVLSIADRNKGEIPGKWETYPSVLAGRTKSTTRHLVTVCKWLTRWLDVDSQGVARVRNYAKYHKTRGENSVPPNLTEPNLTEPNHKEEDNKHRNRKSVAQLVPWPSEDLWLKNLIAQQPFFSHALEQLSDFGWWEDVSTAINGIDPRFIEPEFAKISAWLRENPGRKPTAKGCRRFVRTWLERARENQRRLYAVKK